MQFIAKSIPSSIAIDVESTGLFPYLGDRPFSVAMCWWDGRTEFFSAPVDPYTRNVAWLCSDKHKILQSILANSNITKVFHNAPFDIGMLRAAGFIVNDPIDDTMFMWKVLNSYEDASLKFIGENYLDISLRDVEDLRNDTSRARREGKSKGWKLAENIVADYWMANPSLLRSYNIMDATRTMLLYRLLIEQLNKDPKCMCTYKFEMQLMNATQHMINYGIYCDTKVCKFEIRKQKLIKLEATLKMRKLLNGYELNVNSPMQVAKFVYNKLGFQPKNYTNKGQPSADDKALTGIDHPIVKEIIRIKACDKAISNFFGKYLFHTIKQSDGLTIMHPSFNQIRARTGRFSCSNPNLQNVANAWDKDDIAPIQARTPFKPRPGKVWWHFDWSQMEMWMFAAETNDKGMLADLKGNLHTATANRVFGKGRDIVSEELSKSSVSTSRIRAKLLNFGIIYGMGAKATARLLNCGEIEAAEILKLYYKAYPAIKAFMHEYSKLANMHGCIYNRFGRRLQVPTDASYRAVNYLVQSSSADYMKRKMLWMYENRKSIGMDLVLTVHDELVGEGSYKLAANGIIHKVKQELEDVKGVWPNLERLPVDVSITITCWAEKEKFKLGDSTWNGKEYTKRMALRLRKPLAIN